MYYNAWIGSLGEKCRRLGVGAILAQKVALLLVANAAHAQGTANCLAYKSCEMVGEWAVSYVGEMQPDGFRQFWKAWFAEKPRSVGWQGVGAYCDDLPSTQRSSYRPLSYRFHFDIAVGDYDGAKGIAGNTRITFLGEQPRTTSAELRGNIIAFYEPTIVANLIKIEKPFTLEVDYPEGVRVYYFKAPIGARDAITRVQDACESRIS
jgi:hypothetical protein